MEVQLSTHRIPWIIHTAAFFYIATVFFMLYDVFLFIERIDALSLAISISVIAFPALFAGLNLWTLYHPTRLNRWIPIASALIGIIGIVVVQKVVVPWSAHISLSDEFFRPLLLIIGLSFVFALTTVCNVIMLFGHPPTRKYLLQVPASV